MFAINSFFALSASNIFSFCSFIVFTACVLSTMLDCNAFNWIVAEKNEHAYQLYEKFVKKYFGHKVGKRHFGQKAYDGEISDVFLYEITKEEYFTWKEKQCSC